MTDRFTAIGLMSGTSMDGVDVAVIDTDGDNVIGRGACETHAYDASWREQLHQAVARSHDYDAPVHNDFFSDIERRLTQHHCDILADFMNRHGVSHCDVIGFHGQTLRHAPQARWCWQLGDGQQMAVQMKTRVVNRFRDGDLAHGGQGAPLVPLFHRALARADGWHPPLAIMNIGGIANVTALIAPDDVRASDVGVGMALLDDFCLNHGLHDWAQRDELAAHGQPHEETVARYGGNSFFAGEFWHKPRALHRQDFHEVMQDAPASLSLADGCATWIHCTAVGVMVALHQLAKVMGAHCDVVVCGGGRHQKQLMSLLRARWDGQLVNCDERGWQGDGVEAQAFAWLAVRSMRGLPLTLPSTTGVSQAVTGGLVWQP